MSRLLRRTAPVVAVLIVALALPAIAQAADPLRLSSAAACNESIRGHGGTNIALGGTKACRAGTEHSEHHGAPPPVTRKVDCGPPQVVGEVRPGPGQYCAYLALVCAVPSAALLPTDPTITTQVTLERQPNGTWTQIGFDCSVKAAAPQVTALMVRERARKLVPHPGIGIAPPGGATLVNIQTLLWLNTPANQPLGTVTLLGHRVAIRVHIEHVDWTFGDGHTDTTTGPQRKYDPAHACRTITCPGYWGHTYASIGTMTIDATVTWSGHYQVDGGTPVAITGTVTSPATTTSVTVRQARGVLVPDPNTH